MGYRIDGYYDIAGLELKLEYLSDLNKNGEAYAVEGPSGSMLMTDLDDARETLLSQVTWREVTDDDIDAEILKTVCCAFQNGDPSPDLSAEYVMALNRMDKYIHPVGSIPEVKEEVVRQFIAKYRDDLIKEAQKCYEEYLADCREDGEPATKYSWVVFSDVTEDVSLVTSAGAGLFAIARATGDSLEILL